MGTTLTTASLSRALSVMPDLHFSPHVAAGLPVLHVDDTVRYQHMLGFGAAMTDSSAWLIRHRLSASARQHVMSALFGPGGIHLTMTRVPIGASDFTAGERPYTYDDLPAGQTDPTLAHFSVAHDDQYIVPALRQVLRINPSEQVLATPWTPPPWMKANQGFDNWHDAGVTLNDDLQPLADYFVRFVKSYAERGIPIWGVTPQNEPSAATPYPGSLLAAPTEAQFVAQDLAPALAAAGLHTRIYGNDGGGAAALSYTQTLLGGSGASALSGIAWHCYGGNQFMSVIHQSNPGVQQIVSECSPGIIPYSASEAAISGARNWASAILLWNVALDQTGSPVQPPNSGCTHCTGLVTISERSAGFRYTPSYYQLGQLSRFVLPGAVRVATERWVGDVSFPPAPGSYAYGVSTGVDNVAFVNPNGTHVLIAYNGSTSRQRFAVSWHGQSFAYALSPRSTVTFTWR